VATKQLGQLNNCKSKTTGKANNCKGKWPQEHLLQSKHPLLSPLPCGFSLYQVWSLTPLAVRLQTPVLFLQPSSPPVDCCSCLLVVVFSFEFLFMAITNVQVGSFVIYFQFFFLLLFILVNASCCCFAVSLQVIISSLIILLSSCHDCNTNDHNAATGNNDTNVGDNNATAMSEPWLQDATAVMQPEMMMQLRENMTHPQEATMQLQWQALSVTARRNKNNHNDDHNEHDENHNNSVETSVIIVAGCFLLLLLLSITTTSWWMCLWCQSTTPLKFLPLLVHSYGRCHCHKYNFQHCRVNWWRGMFSWCSCHCCCGGAEIALYGAPDCFVEHV